MSSRVRLFRTFSFFLFLVASLSAQDFRATVVGEITDPSGAAIPRATVKITSSETNQTKEATSNDSGSFTLPYLEPGRYTLTVTANGFQTIKRTNVVLQVTQRLNLPVHMEVGQMSQEVTVQSQANQIDTADADRGLVFDPVKTQQYPLNGRQEYMLMALTPGVLFTQEQFGASGFSGTRGWDENNSYKINGGRPGTSIFLLNGAPINDFNGNWQISPNIEAVQEFKVMTNVYDTGYGRMAGGVVNTTIKSGTNDWHGDVFDYWRNSILDANTVQNNAAGEPRGFHNQHQFGGIVGGPIRKNKDFIFFGFEGWREVVPFPTVTDTVPLALRDGQGFGQLGYQIYDPLTTHTCVSGGGLDCQGSTYVRDPFPGNVIPTSRISPIGAKILSYYPSPNSGGADALNQNFTAAGNRGRYQYNQPIVRWDHVFNDRDKLYGLFTFQHGSEYRNSTGFAGPAGSGNINQERTDQNYIIDWTHVISPTTVLDVRGSFGRFTELDNSHNDLSFTAQDLGIASNISAPTVSGQTAPAVSVGSYSSLFGGVNGNAIGWSSYSQFDFAPSVTMTLGKHTLHTGFEYIYTARPENSPGEAFGQLGFTQFWTQQLSDKNQGQTDGSSVASLLLGYPDAGTSFVDNNVSTYRTRPYYAGYIMDNWKIGSTFTLNWGLRYDVQIPWKERYNQLNSGFDFTTKNPYSDAIISNWNNVAAQYNAANPNDPYGYPAAPSEILGGIRFAGKNGRSERGYTTDWTNVQPRIGIAWQVGPHSVVRAGGGVYYQSPNQENTTYGFNQRTPYIQSLDGLRPSAASGGGDLYTLNNPFPSGIAAIPGSSLGLGTNVGNSIGYDNYEYRVPRTYEYSVGLQQSLPGGMIADLAWTGNYSIYEPTTFNQGYVSYDNFVQGNQNPSYLNRQLPSPYSGILPTQSTFGGSETTSALNLLRLNPLFSDVTENLGQWGHYRYDAFSLQLEKRLNSASAGNFTWVLSYTLSKSYEANHRLNNWNIQEPLINEIDYQDKPQSIAFSGVWDLPFGTGRSHANFQNSLAKNLVSNWTFDWIFTYYSGFPTGWPNLVLNSSVPGCSSWKVANQNSQQWFNNNKACYQTLPPFSFNVNPDRFPDIRNPAQPQVNIAVEKSFPFKERFKFTIRGEAFNLANTVIYGGPNTDFNSPNFGQLPKTQNNFPRVVQLAGKFYF